MSECFEHELCPFVCCLVVLLNVRVKRSARSSTRLQAFEHLLDARTGEAVEDRLAFAAVGDYARVLEDGEVAADGRELVTHGLDELTDAMLPGRQLFDDPEARRMSECLEEHRVPFVVFAIEFHRSDTP